MAKLVEFTVAREHQGDRITEDGTEVHRFMPGETRLANPSIVAALVKSGVLVREGGDEADDADPADEKSEEPHEDKSEGDSAETKAEPKPASTKGGRKPAATKAS